MKVMLTGDLGFVGSATKRLLGNEWVGYDLMRGQDIRDIGQLKAFIEAEKPTHILHLAAISRFADCKRDPRLALETNVLGTSNIVEVAKHFHLPLVYSSTGSVYMPISETPPITEKFQAEGNSQYGCTKYQAELFVEEHTPHIILRYGHIYGAEKRNEGLIGNAWTRIERGLKPQLYGGSQSTDFIYVKDIAQANVLALKAPWHVWNQIFNIGTGEELAIKDAAETVCEVFGWDKGVEVTPARIVDSDRFVYDISKARQQLKFEPKYSFREGLEDMYGEIHSKRPA